MKVNPMRAFAVTHLHLSNYLSKYRLSNLNVASNVLRAAEHGAEAVGMAGTKQPIPDRKCGQRAQKSRDPPPSAPTNVRRRKLQTETFNTRQN